MKINFQSGSAKTAAKTLRDFSGGLNLQDSPHNMTSRYSSELINFFIGDDGSMTSRPPFLNFSNANATIGSNQSTAAPTDWGKYNEPLTLGPSPTIATTLGESYVTIDFDAPHGLVSGNWIKGISALTTGNLGGIPYTQFNNSQWHCVERVSADVVRVRTDTEATSAASITLSTATRYCNKVALMLPQGASSNEQSLGFVDGWYYAGRLILVDRVGVVYAVDASGVISIIHNDIIAKAETGAPRGWRPLADNGPLVTLVTASIFKGTMSLNNGLDKPLEVYQDGTTVRCRYLVDAGTLVNTFTPIGSLSCVNNQYVCIAGQPLRPSCVSISAKGTNGTFVGDPAPNDATELFIDEYSETEGATITGISTFRGRLIVFTANAALVFTLGNYVEGDHVPKYVETLYDFGTRSPRSLSRLNDDLLVLDEVGVAGVSQARISTALEVARFSDVIRDKIVSLLENESSTLLYEGAFTRVDRRNRMLILRLTRSDRTLNINTDTILRYFIGDTRVALELSEQTELRAGDTITFYDFEPQLGIDLSGGADNYRQYVVESVSEDRRYIYVDTGQTAINSGVYVPAVGYAAQVIIENAATSFVREQKDSLLAFRMIPGSRIAAWQEIGGLDKFGPIRSMITTELNNVFVLYPYAIFVMAPQSTLDSFDGDGYAGQNIHSNSLLTSTTRFYHANMPVFDPIESTPIKYPLKHIEIPAPGTLEEDQALDESSWRTFVGRPVEFVYTSPWMDFGSRRKEKECRFIAIDSEGVGAFTIEAFADDIYKGRSGEFQPVASMKFWAGGRKFDHELERNGDRLDPIEASSIIVPNTLIGEQPDDDATVNAFASNQQLHPFDVTFRTLRLRISGDTTYGAVRIVGISLYTADGAQVGA